MNGFNELLTSAGIELPAQTTADLLGKFGLNWNVSKQPLCLPDGSQTPFFGIVRDDNKTTFATCKEGYEPFQNSELCELINEAANTMGLHVDKGGMFKGGGLVYLQLETGSISNIGQNRDTVQKYVSAINSHDGSLSLKWGMTNITISCQNTFWAAAKQMKNSVKHTQSMRAKIDTIIREIESVQNAEKSLYDVFFKLAEVPVQKEHISLLTKLALEIDLNDSKLGDLTAYQKNRVQELSLSINKEMRQKGQTLWGLFSGLTNYTTHVMPGGNENRKQSKAIGKGYEIDNTVFTAFAEMVK